MYSDDTAIRVEGVSKRYELYDAPHDRLKQFIFPRVQRVAGVECKQYFSEFWALKDISFEIKKGESVGIVGRNGSGKSTLLQIIAGTLSPTIGTVSTYGRIAALLELGSGFNPDFSGRENVYLNGALLGFNREQINEKFDAIAAFADIGLHLEQPVKTYSSGMLVRLAFAVQVQVEPDILIVDEALAVGDALFQKRCFRQIENLLGNGCTLLFVTHNIEIVRAMTNRSIFINKGSVQKNGSSTEVLYAYREFLQKEEERIFNQQQQDLMHHVEARGNPLSYGNLDVEILHTYTSGEGRRKQTVFYAGDTINIEIECVCNIATENLNVAFRIINKEGVRITTWGTLNEDMKKFDLNMGDSFWSKKFNKGDHFKMRFEGVCNLTQNLYEVQVVVAREYDKYYNNQRILHWVDEACHFTVVHNIKKYVFDGICDMGLRSIWGGIS